MVIPGERTGCWFGGLCVLIGLGMIVVNLPTWLVVAGAWILLGFAIIGLSGE